MRSVQALDAHHAQEVFRQLGILAASKRRERLELGLQDESMAFVGGLSFLETRCPFLGVAPFGKSDKETHQFVWGIPAF